MDLEMKISLEEFKNKNVIHLDNIQDGFDKYPNLILEGTEEYVNKAIRKLVFENGFENSFADFYYGRLEEDSKSKVKAVLNENEVNLIESLNLSGEDIFFRLNSELLEVLLKLTASEILFSSFYFAKYPCLVWGNYERKYPVFFKDDSVMEIITKQLWK
ncbi:MAG: hypothetical protein AB6733_23760 [Clostridiaceae bacterium]